MKLLMTLGSGKKLVSIGGTCSQAPVEPQVVLLLGFLGPLSLSLSASPASLKAETAAARLDGAAHSSQTTWSLPDSRKPAWHASPTQDSPAAAHTVAGGHVGIWLRQAIRSYPIQLAVAMPDSEGQGWATAEGN